MDLSALELELEKDAVTVAVERYRAMRAEGLTKVGPGVEMLKRALDPMIAAINEAIDSAKAGRAGRAVAVLQFLDQFDADVLAFAALRAAIDAADKGLPLASAAATLGEALEAQVNYEQMREANPEVYDYMMRQRHHVTGSTSSRWLVMRMKSRWLGLQQVKWGARERARVGAMLISLVCEHAGIVEAVLDGDVTEGQKNAVYVLRFTPEAAAWLENAHAMCEVRRPQHYPMVVPPRPWTTLRDGGYLTLRYDLVKAGRWTTLGDLDQHDMPAVIAAANVLQSSAYRIAPGVLRVLQDVMAEQSVRVPGLPIEASLPPEPVRPANVDDPTSSEFKVFKKARAEWHAARARMLQQQADVRRKLLVAEKLADAPALYFPVVADWRGRFYYKAQPLNPQGDDLAKGLLQFSEARPLGENGAYWLAVHLATSFGVDKVPFDERVQWVNDHRAEIICAGMDPLGPKGGLWLRADAPWVFLSAAIEYHALAFHVAKGGRPAEFESRTIPWTVRATGCSTCPPCCGTPSVAPR